MTFEKVLEVFADHLREDTDCEVIQTRHGYTVLIWDSRAQDWETCEYCPMPEALRDRLAEAYSDYSELKITCGKRELLSREKTQIQKTVSLLCNQCEE